MAYSCQTIRSGLGGSTNGARFGASAAFNAGFRIDLEFAVSFTDGGNGALGGTGTAADAFIRDFVSHDPYLQSFVSRIRYVLVY